MPAVLSQLTSPTASSTTKHVGQTLYLLLLLAIAAILLEKGCTYTLDNIAQIALVANLDQTLVSLLTAGGEWEELVVVIAAIRQARSALAIGNIVGAAISNILGAFSLGLIFAPSSSSSSPTQELTHGFRYADIDPHTGLSIVRVGSNNLAITTTTPPDPDRFTFDHSAKTYATIQFLITTIVAPLLYFAQASADQYAPIQPGPPPSPPPSRIKYAVVEWSPAALRLFASALIALFVLYLLSVGAAVYKGWIAPPPDSDSDSSSSSSSSSSAADVEDDGVPDQHRPQGFLAGIWAKRFWSRHRGPNEESLVPGSGPPSYGATTTSSSSQQQQEGGRRRRRRRQRAADDSSPITHWLFTHLPSSRLWLSILPRLAIALAGLVLLALAGYLLSSAGSQLAALWGWSDTVFGLTVLSFVTTVPEKALSAVAGAKGLSGALAGASAGSNIFLLSLCTGVALFGLAEERDAALARRSEVTVSLLKWEEMALLWVCSLVLCIIVCLTGGRRWHGWVLLLGYVLYLIAELTVWKR